MAFEKGCELTSPSIPHLSSEAKSRFAWRGIYLQLYDCKIDSIQRSIDLLSPPPHSRASVDNNRVPPLSPLRIPLSRTVHRTDSVVETGTLAFVQKLLDGELCFTVSTGNSSRNEHVKLTDGDDVVTSKLIDGIFGDGGSAIL